MRRSAVSICSVYAVPKFNNKKVISVISREDGSGTRGAFIELFGIEKKNANGKKVDYTTDEAAITNSSAVMLTSVSGDRYAIGYVSLGSLNESVKAVKIDGADATVAALRRCGASVGSWHVECGCKCGPGALECEFFLPDM